MRTHIVRLFEAICITGLLTPCASVTYFLYPVARTWNDAKCVCGNSGMTLLKLTSWQQYIDVSAITFSPSVWNPGSAPAEVWIGLYDQDKANGNNKFRYVWYPESSETPWVPTLTGNKRDECTSITNSDWLKHTCSMTLPFVCMQDTCQNEAMSDKVLDSGVISTGSGTSLSQCGDECKNTPQCHAFQFRSGDCSYYLDATTPTSSAQIPTQASVGDTVFYRNCSATVLVNDDRYPHTDAGSHPNFATPCSSSDPEVSSLTSSQGSSSVSHSTSSQGEPVVTTSVTSMAPSTPPVSSSVDTLLTWVSSTSSPSTTQVEEISSSTEVMTSSESSTIVASSLAEVMTSSESSTMFVESSLAEVMTSSESSTMFVESSLAEVMTSSESSTMFVESSVAEVMTSSESSTTQIEDVSSSIEVMTSLESSATPVVSSVAEVTTSSELSASPSELLSSKDSGAISSSSVDLSSSSSSLSLSSSDAVPTVTISAEPSTEQLVLEPSTSLAEWTTLEASLSPSTTAAASVAGTQGKMSASTSMSIADISSSLSSSQSEALETSATFPTWPTQSAYTSSPVPSSASNLTSLSTATKIAPVVSRKRQCQCRCRQNGTEAAQKVEQLVEELALNKSSISAHRRLKESIPDKRVSAKTIGALGIITVTFSLGGFVFMDLTKLVGYVKRRLAA